MGVQRRVDSIADKLKQKSNKELTEENEWLKEQLINTHLAMCEMYEQFIAGGGS